MTTAKTFRLRLGRWLERKSDDAVLRALLGAMLTTTAMVLAFDYAELDARSSEPTSITRAAPAVSDDLVPVARPDGGKGPGNRLSDASFRSRMAFDLVADGRLMATGTIEPGTAERFAVEIEKRGGYVKTIVLHSPGGSVSDALAMGRLIRSRAFATEVENGRTCASSCPLVFAGGVERRAGRSQPSACTRSSPWIRRGPQGPPAWTTVSACPRSARNSCATWGSTRRSGCMRWKRPRSSCIISSPTSSSR